MYASRGSVERWLEVLSDAAQLSRDDVAVISWLRSDLMLQVELSCKRNATFNRQALWPITRRSEVIVDSALCARLLEALDRIAATVPDVELRAEARELAQLVYVGEELDPHR